MAITRAKGQAAAAELPVAIDSGNVRASTAAKPRTPRTDGAAKEAKAARSADDNLKSLSKLVRVLDCFSVNDRNLSLAEICQRTGLPRSTAHRMMASLRDVGFLDQDKERDRYRLGLKLFELGSVALSNLDLHREARPMVDALRRISGQSVHLAVFDGSRAVVIQRADSSSESSGGMTFIENAPAHCTSVGKAILAYQSEEVVDRLIAGGLQRFTESTITKGEALKAELKKIRKRGFSIDEGEHQPGLRCIGAPIRNQAGQVFAGLSISGPAWQLPISEVDDFAKVVMHHANSISQRLGYNH
jgi:DNA-binding IclR family transcriptional regulator